MDIPAHLNCVYNTLSFIENNYDRGISVKELEAVSHYSYRNIQRIFRYTCGETIGAYQKRLRVEHAYKMILYGKDTLSSIALTVGFANLASFSKAFKQHYQVSPGEARAQKTPLLARAGILPIEAALVLQPRLVYIPPITVYYKSSFIPYADTAIEAQWESFMQHQFPGHDVVYYGVVTDEPLIREQLDCRYDTCASVQASDGSLPSKTIGGGRYAQFIHYGSYETIEETYTNIYAGWILTTQLRFGTSPVIEQYTKHPDNTGSIAEQVTYIWLPLA